MISFILIFTPSPTQLPALVPKGGGQEGAKAERKAWRGHSASTETFPSPPTPKFLPPPPCKKLF